MPTYDYACRSCGHQFEELQSFSEPALTTCPACKKKALERLFGGGGAIIFKGSGFYETDYRRAGDSKNATKSEGDSSAAKSDTTAPATSPPPAPASGSASTSTGSTGSSGGTSKTK